MKLDHFWVVILFLFSARSSLPVSNGSFVSVSSKTILLPWNRSWHLNCPRRFLASSLAGFLRWAVAGRGLRSKPPGEENLEILTQNRANPVPYYLPGDVLLVHSLRRPLASTIPPKKAVVGLGLCATLSDMLCVSKTAGVSAWKAWKLALSFRFLRNLKDTRSGSGDRPTKLGNVLSSKSSWSFQNSSFDQ